MLPAPAPLSFFSAVMHSNNTTITFVCLAAYTSVPQTEFFGCWLPVLIIDFVRRSRSFTFFPYVYHQTHTQQCQLVWLTIVNIEINKTRETFFIIFWGILFDNGRRTRLLFNDISFFSFIFLFFCSANTTVSACALFQTQVCTTQTHIKPAKSFHLEFVAMAGMHNSRTH